MQVNEFTVGSKQICYCIIFFLYNEKFWIIRGVLKIEDVTGLIKIGSNFTLNIRGGAVIKDYPFEPPKTTRLLDV